MHRARRCFAAAVPPADVGLIDGRIILTPWFVVDPGHEGVGNLKSEDIRRELNPGPAFMANVFLLRSHECKLEMDSGFHDGYRDEVPCTGPLDNRPGQDGYTHSGGHHCQHEIKVTAPSNDRGGESLRPTRVLDQPAQLEVFGEGD